MIVRVIEDLGEFLSLEGAWDALMESMEHPTPFLTHTWVRLWWGSFSGGNDLHILTVWHDSGKLLGILPLQRTTCRVMKIFTLPCLHSLTNGHSVMFDLICRPEDRDAVLGAVKAHLLNNSRQWGVVVLGYVPHDFGTVEAVKQQMAGDGLVVFSEPRDGSYYIGIDGDFARYYSGLNKNFRDNRKNIDNRMSRAGGVDFEVLRDYSPEPMHQLYRLEDTGWKKSNGSSIASSVELVSFYDRVAEAFAAKKQFVLTTVRLANKPVASIFGLVFKDTFYFLKVGANYTDPVYSKLSPGQVVLHRLIEYCFAAGLKRFDFYGPCYGYEAHWTKQINRRHTIMIFNRCSIASNLCVVGKQVLFFIMGLLKKNNFGAGVLPKAVTK